VVGASAGESGSLLPIYKGFLLVPKRDSGGLETPKGVSVTANLSRLVRQE
jgi:hypothetical protein